MPRRVPAPVVVVDEDPTVAPQGAAGLPATPTAGPPAPLVAGPPATPAAASATTILSVVEGLAQGSTILEHEVAQVLLFFGFVFSILQYFSGSIGEYTIHMIASGSPASSLVRCWTASLVIPELAPDKYCSVGEGPNWDRKRSLPGLPLPPSLPSATKPKPSMQQDPHCKSDKLRKCN